MLSDLVLDGMSIQYKLMLNTFICQECGLRTWVSCHSYRCHHYRFDWSNKSVCIIPPAEIPTYIREQVSELCLLLPLPSVDLSYECLMCEFKFLFVYIDHFSVI